METKKDPIQSVSANENWTTILQPDAWSIVRLYLGPHEASFLQKSPESMDAGVLFLHFAKQPLMLKQIQIQVQDVNSLLVAAAYKGNVSYVEWAYARGAALSDDAAKIACLHGNVGALRIILRHSRTTRPVNLAECYLLALESKYESESMECMYELNSVDNATGWDLQFVTTFADGSFVMDSEKLTEHAFAPRIYIPDGTVFPNSPSICRRGGQSMYSGPIRRVAHAAASGSIRKLAAMLQHLGPIWPFQDVFFEVAAMHGNHEGLEVLHQTFPRFDSFGPIAAIASEHGYSKCMSWAFNKALGIRGNAYAYRCLSNALEIGNQTCVQIARKFIQQNHPNPRTINYELGDVATTSKAVTLASKLYPEELKSKTYENVARIAIRYSGVPKHHSLGLDPRLQDPDDPLDRVLLLESVLDRCDMKSLNFGFQKTDIGLAADETMLVVAARFNRLKCMKALKPLTLYASWDAALVTAGFAASQLIHEWILESPEHPSYRQVLAGKGLEQKVPKGSIRTHETKEMEMETETDQW